MKTFCVLVFLFLAAANCFPQRKLNIYGTRWFRTERLELFEGSDIKYKVRGGFITHRNKISAFDDSLLYFTNGAELPLKKLRLIKLYNGNHLTDAFQKFFKELGILFITLDTANNLITDKPQVVNEKAVIIAAGLIATGFAIERIGIKKVRIRNSTVFKAIDINYSELNTPK